MLAEAFPSALVVGIDTSPAFVAEATALGVRDAVASPSATSPGRPCPVHRPTSSTAGSSSSISPTPVPPWRPGRASSGPGGVVVVEEPERIDTDDPDFRRYLELADAVVADRGGDLYVGHELLDLAAPPDTSVIVHRDAPLEVTAGAAASIFSLNLGHLGGRPRARRGVADAGRGRRVAATTPTPLFGPQHRGHQVAHAPGRRGAPAGQPRPG